jgi:hypothetical protein
MRERQRPEYGSSPASRPDSPRHVKNDSGNVFETFRIAIWRGRAVAISSTVVRTAADTVTGLLGCPRFRLLPSSARFLSLWTAR